MRAKKKVEEPKAEQPEQPALRLEYWEPEKLNEHLVCSDYIQPCNGMAYIM